MLKVNWTFLTWRWCKFGFILKLLYVANLASPSSVLALYFMGEFSCFFQCGILITVILYLICSKFICLKTILHFLLFKIQKLNPRVLLYFKKCFFYCMYLLFDILFNFVKLQLHFYIFLSIVFKKFLTFLSTINCLDALHLAC